MTRFDLLKLLALLCVASFYIASFFNASFFVASFFDAYFFVASFFVASFFDASFFIASFVVASLFVASFFDASFSIASFFNASFFYASFFDASFFIASFFDASFFNASFFIASLLWIQIHIDAVEDKPGFIKDRATVDLRKDRDMVCQKTWWERVVLEATHWNIKKCWNFVIIGGTAQYYCCTRLAATPPMV